MVDSKDLEQEKTDRNKISTHCVEGEHGVTILLGQAPEVQGITTDTVDPVEKEKPKRGRPPKGD